MCNSPSTLDRYREELQRCASGHLSARITNKNEDYAAAFYGELFRNTETTAKIFCEGAHSCIWRNFEFQTAFEELLNKSRVHIWVLTEENERNLDRFPEYLQKVIRDKSSHIEFRHLTTKAREIITSRFEDDVNFAVFDNDKFRFEFDKTHYTAYGSFNDPDIVKEINKYFDEAFETSEVTEFNLPNSSFDVAINSAEYRYIGDGSESTTITSDTTHISR